MVSAREADYWSVMSMILPVKLLVFPVYGVSAGRSACPPVGA